MLLRRRATLRRAPRQERSSFTFVSILDAAQLLLLNRDGGPLQMAPLAKRAGVSIGTLYQYFPDRIAVLTALLERIWERAVTDFRLRFESFQATTLPGFLEELSALVAELAHREHALRVAVHAALRRDGTVGQQIDISMEWIAFFASLLRGFLPDVPEERLMSMSRAMVWTADGMVDGVSGWRDVSREELQNALHGAWRGIILPA